MMEIGNTRFYHDPLAFGANDIQELSKPIPSVHCALLILAHDATRATAQTGGGDVGFLQYEPMITHQQRMSANRRACGCRKCEETYRSGPLWADTRHRDNSKKALMINHPVLHTAARQQ